MIDISDLQNPSHTFIIAEAGSNWKSGTIDDDLNQAKKLIKIASESGADAVKFQTFKANSIYVKNAGDVSYLKTAEKDIWKLFDELSMPYGMIKELSEYCKQNNIHFMSSPFSIEDAKEVNPYVELHKIASYELNHVRLLDYISNTNKPIILSTGASNYEEIDFAVEIMKKKSSPIAILQCTSNYPTDFDSLNLSVIPKMKKKYCVPLGLSDHSSHPLIAPLMAIGMGATIIEKHFTIDKNLKGPDHFFSLNPTELKMMVDAIRNADKSKGSGIKEVQPVETELRKFAKRSIQTIRDIVEGEQFQEGVNIDILRPGNRKRGADPRFLNSISNKIAKRNISTGDGVTLEDVE